MDNEHYGKLARMYLQAPVNVATYNGLTIEIMEGKAELQLPIHSAYFHAANSAHGSIYFKLLDDAAFFAANSVVTDVFLYTVSFNVHLLRPVTEGTVKAIGELTFRAQNLYTANSVLYLPNGKIAATGTGTFMRSKIELQPGMGYK